MGVVRPSTSLYVSPIVMVKKKMVLTGCVLTLGVEQDQVDPENMMTAEDMFRRLNGTKYLSKINLTKGYWQIPLHKDVYKTGFVSPDR